ncbi:MAG: glucosaminidase domain-containing protein, partial [Paludibacteraceae bacterium]|nr:glucosaminidase domain-containing protein [Paludibacteraceae bacterium]
MKRFLLLLICTAGMMLTHAQKLYQTYLEYIDRYAASAIEEQKKYGIPASITLSQGLLESQAGQSELARNTNNHFGIKCHNDWTGGTYYYDDDARGECFRVYDRVEQSFDDHSKFLANRQRYADLFELDPTDYKAWAKGLKADGYATDPNYANKLIKLIEDYELHRFDTWSQTAAVQQGTARTSTSKSDTKTSKTSTTATKDSRKTTASSSTTAAKRPVIRNNGIRCVEAR